MIAVPALSLPLVPLADTPTSTVGNPAINISIFVSFVLVTLVVVIRASKSTATAADYYAGGRSFSGTQNGLAIAGGVLDPEAAAATAPAWPPSASAIRDVRSAVVHTDVPGRATTTSAAALLASYGEAGRSLMSSR